MMALVAAMLIAQSPLECSGDATLTPCEAALWRAGMLDRRAAHMCALDLRACHESLAIRTSTVIPHLVPLPPIPPEEPEERHRWLDYVAIGAVGVGLGILVGAYAVGH
jgi:hypothetical protein